MSQSLLCLLFCWILEKQQAPAYRMSGIAGHQKGNDEEGAFASPLRRTSFDHREVRIFS